MGLTMTKKRKACSPTDGVQSDLCEELKKFIVEENAKCVREIQAACDGRLVAIEESLSFAMDSLTAVSNRQYSADLDIVQLRKETAHLRRRVQELELAEDKRLQEQRLPCLFFSGPAVQTHTQRDHAVRQIQSVVRQYLNHALDDRQVKAVIRLQNGKILVEFTSFATGSDRDILFRSKAKLKGSGLFIAESLTPRRQVMFSELLRMRKEGRIHSVFTRSGDILVCRSRGSAPIRIADPEAVRQLAGGDPPERPDRGRARGERGAAPPHPAPSGEQRSLGRTATSPRSADSNMAAVMHGPVENSPGRRGSYSGPSRASAADGVGSSDTSEVQRPRRTTSSLLECAQTPAVRLVRLSPPLREAPSPGAPAELLTGATGDGRAPQRRPATWTAAVSDAPLAVTSEAAGLAGAARESDGDGDHREAASVTGPVSRPTADAATVGSSGTGSGHGPVGKDRSAGVREARSTAPGNPVTGSRSRDIREYF